MNLYLKRHLNSKQIIFLSLYYDLTKRQKQKDLKIRKKQKALKIRKKQPKQGKKQKRPNYNFQRKIINDEFVMEHIYTDLTDSDWNERESHKFQRKKQIGDELKIKIKSVSLEPTMAMDVEMDDDFGMEHIYTDLTDSDWNERETHKFQKKYK